MLKKITFKANAAVPYLMGSELMVNRPDHSIELSTEKPNLLVGPNGSGKSAFIKTLALRFLAYTTGFSAFDNAYTSSVSEIDGLWTEKSWRTWAFMDGIECDTDNGPALYFRPGMIPGDNTSFTHAMMCGYSELARTFARRVEDKSSGQGVQAMLEHVIELLRGQIEHDTYEQVNWSYGTKPVKLKDTASSWVSPSAYQAEVLKAMFGGSKAGTTPLVLLDEPEQSLDVHAQLQFWNTVRSCNKVQVVIATHSVVPLMEPDRYNFIETVPGYLAEAVKLINKPA